MTRPITLLISLAAAAAPAFANDTAPKADDQSAYLGSGGLDLTEKPLWELGIGVSGIHLPDYRGSDESRNYLLPYPYIVYRGRWLKSDKDGARAMLYDSTDAKLDVSFGGSTPVDSDDNRARSGMPDLPGVGEFGPNLNLTIAHSKRDRWKLDLRFPVRAAISLESSPRFIGWTFSPNLNLDISGPSASWNIGLLTGPLFANRKFHEEYYNVDAPYVTPDRPAYQAHGGYGGWQNTLSASRQFGPVWLGGFVRHEALGGAVYEDSPLVKRNSALSMGFAVSYVLKTSTETVPSAK